MNKVKKIFVLCGYMGSGKDTLLKEICKLNPQIHQAVSHTTRPIREGEVEGVNYYYISKDKFLDMRFKDKFIEAREYHTKVEKEGKVVNDVWYYGFSKEEFDSHEYSIAIADGDGFHEIKKYYGNNKVVPIYIQVPEEQLIQRALNRGDLEDEVKRRISDDKKRFLPFRVKTVYHTIKNDDGQFEVALKELNALINRIIDLDTKALEKSKRKKSK